MEIYSIFLISFLFFSLSHAQMTCPRGLMLKNGKCVGCVAGSGLFLGRCRPCHKGSYNPVDRTKSFTGCYFCPPNYTTPGRGALECTACPEGTVSEGGFRPCLGCTPGSGLNFNTGRCAPCSRGYYNDRLISSAECKICPYGTTSGTGATTIEECKPCPPGQGPVSDISGGGNPLICEPCPGYSYNPGDTLICLRCPPGRITGFKTGQTACMKCGQGMKLKFKRNTIVCEPCPDGYTTMGPGSAFCTPIGATRCPKSTRTDKFGSCIQCGPQQRFNKRKRKCVMCPLGSVSQGGTTTKCTVCSGGSRPDPIRNRCVCNEGFKMNAAGRCVPCPAGTFGQDGVCEKCYGGLFNDKKGKTSCRICPLGMASGLGEGASECFKCPNGLITGIGFNPLYSGLCVEPKTGCPPGWTPNPGVNIVGVTLITEFCIPPFCTPDTPAEEIGKSCMPCPRGWFLKDGSCERCTGNSVSQGGVVTQCTSCKDGFTSNARRAATGCLCNAFTKGVRNGKCRKCLPGTEPGATNEACIPCEVGSFAAMLGSSRCVRCPAGMVASRKGRKDCTSCPPGTAPEKIAGAAECIPVM